MRWDVSDRWRALGLLDEPIVSASAGWRRSSIGPAVEYPQDARVVLGAGRVVVFSAFERRRPDFSTDMTDHITVFFDESEARRLVDGTL
jgi:hypothetical protein